MTLSPVKDIEWTKDSLGGGVAADMCRQVEQRGEKTNKRGKQGAQDGQRTDVFFCKGHKYESKAARMAEGHRQL